MSRLAAPDAPAVKLHDPDGLLHAGISNNNPMNTRRGDTAKPWPRRSDPRTGGGKGGGGIAGDAVPGTGRPRSYEWHALDVAGTLYPVEVYCSSTPPDPALGYDARYDPWTELWVGYRMGRVRPAG